MSETDELVARLRAHESTGYAKPIGHPLDSYTTRMENGAIIGHEIYAEILPITKLRNPDGPAAADELARLQAELREARHERDGETRRADVAQEKLNRTSETTLGGTGPLTRAVRRYGDARVSEAFEGTIPVFSQCPDEQRELDAAHARIQYELARAERLLWRAIERRLDAACQETPR